MHRIKCVVEPGTIIYKHFLSITSMVENFRVEVDFLRTLSIQHFYIFSTLVMRCIKLVFP